jgi:hypothetical protein
VGWKHDQQDIAEANKVSHDAVSRLSNRRQERNAPDGLWEALTDPSRKAGADYPYQHQAMTGFLSRLQEKRLGHIPVFSKAGPRELPSTVPV